MGVASLLLSQGLPAVAESPRQINLSGPEAAKLDWNTRALTLCDVDGDGRMDFVVINNDRAKIELLLQKDPHAPAEESKRSVRRNRWEPLLEDARFRRETIVSGDYLYALAAGDLNNDGRIDFASTGNKIPLTVRYQENEGEWSNTWTFEEFEPEQWISTLEIADLNGDNRGDLIVLAKEELLIFYQTETGELEEPKSYRVSDENNFGLQLVDLNRDGLVDLFYALAQSKRSLRLRLQNEGGGFGPEIAIPIESATSSIRAWPLELEDRAGFAYIQSKTRHVELATLQSSPPERGHIEALQPKTYSTGASIDNASLYTMGDFNGDGLADLVLGDSRGARVHLFLQREDGIFSEPIAFPSLASLTSVLAGDFAGEGRAALAVLSAKEGILGLARYSPKGRLEFPEPIPVSGEPIAMTVGDIDQDGRDDIILVSKIKKKYSLSIIPAPDYPGNRDQNADQRIAAENLENEPFLIDGLNRDPKDLLMKDLNSDGLPDIIVLIPREAARIFLQNEKSLFIEVSQESAIRKGLLNNLKLSQIGQGDLDGDGSNELLLGSDGFTRSLRLDEDGELEIIDQYNARRSEDAVRGPLVIDMNKDGVNELLFYDEKTKSIQMLEQDEAGVYRFGKSFEVGNIDLLFAQVRKLGRIGREHVLIFGSDRFWSIPMDAAGWGMDTIATYETDLKDIRYTGLDIGDLDGDGKPEIIALDGKNHLLEILREEEENNWTSALHFTVFDSNPHYQGRRGANLEPREIVVGDLTGDGRDDFALLIHDRLLFYFQE